MSGSVRARVRLHRLTWGATAFLLLSVVAWVLVFQGFLDLHVYRTGALAWRTGVPLYSPGFAGMVPGMPLPFTYPPFAAIVFTPVQLLPWHVAKFAVTLASAAAMAVTTTITARRLLPDRAAANAVGMSVAALWFVFEPARQTIGFGQVNLVLMALVTADCLLPRTRWPRGLLIGVAAAVKLTPAVFVLFFLVRRQYRAAVTAFASFLACALAGLALAPGDTVEYWTKTLFDPERIGGLAYAFNQNVQAVLVRLLPEGTGRTALWAALAAAVMVLAVLAARRTRDDVTALLAIAAGGLLASPVSWSHHWVWILPGAVALLVHVRRGGSKTVSVIVLAIFAAGPHSWLPQTHDVERHWTWWQHLAGSSYVLLSVIALGVLAFRVPPYRTLYGGNSGSDALVEPGGRRYRPSRSGDTGGPGTGTDRPVTSGETEDVIDTVG
ncbi:glycosyltransferase 87 family protein [Amycolatopsis endophytica]|uniref:Alpha-1,2-mannosyltransferase n=1 Tax=Amycolatopsis endophytica TaxID=860233 RepID=A0A853B8Y8_9PSEU|nr:glycosyltransferase 87 family protein [Amycolatopsis endophytica]NYI91234.1 alpha-1,2-mannosyltransferase [Amycolatopsis endophytica]